MEPANFARPDKTLPPDAVHRTDVELRTHAEAHNLYGMEMARASRDGLLQHAGRPVPTRGPRPAPAGGHSSSRAPDTPASSAMPSSDGRQFLEPG